MLSFLRWFVRVSFLAMLGLLPACASSCSCESADEVPPIRALLPCKARGKSVTIAPPLSNRVIVPGSIPQSFGVDAIGNAVASLSLTVAPSRGPQPATATGRLSSDAATARPVDDHFLTASLEFAYHFRDEARHEPL